MPGAVSAPRSIFDHRQLYCTCKCCQARSQHLDQSSTTDSCTVPARVARRGLSTSINLRPQTAVLYLQGLPGAVSAPRSIFDHRQLYCTCKGCQARSQHLDQSSTTDSCTVPARVARRGLSTSINLRPQTAVLYLQGLPGAVSAPRSIFDHRQLYCTCKGCQARSQHLDQSSTTDSCTVPARVARRGLSTSINLRPQTAVLYLQGLPGAVSAPRSIFDHRQLYCTCKGCQARSQHLDQSSTTDSCTVPARVARRGLSTSINLRPQTAVLYLQGLPGAVSAPRSIFDHRQLYCTCKGCQARSQHLDQSSTTDSCTVPARVARRGLSTSINLRPQTAVLYLQGLPGAVSAPRSIFDHRQLYCTCKGCQARSQHLDQSSTTDSCIISGDEPRCDKPCGNQVCKHINTATKINIYHKTVTLAIITVILLT